MADALPVGVSAGSQFYDKCAPFGLQCLLLRQRRVSLYLQLSVHGLKIRRRIIEWRCHWFPLPWPPSSHVSLNRAYKAGLARYPPDTPPLRHTASGSSTAAAFSLWQKLPDDMPSLRTRWPRVIDSADLPQAALLPVLGSRRASRRASA